MNIASVSLQKGYWDKINDNLKFIIENQKYSGVASLDRFEFIHSIANFLSSLWQIHAFEKGNTLVIAVFLLKYLSYMKIDYVNNDMFEKHLWYFRNALVRANYENLEKGIKSTTYYLEQFLGNLIFGMKNELHNRDIHVSNIEIAKKVGRSLRTVKSLTKSLSDKGAIKRENGKRYGYWVVQI